MTTKDPRHNPSFFKENSQMGLKIALNVAILERDIKRITDILNGNSIHTDQNTSYPSYNLLEHKLGNLRRQNPLLLAITLAAGDTQTLQNSTEDVANAYDVVATLAQHYDQLCGHYPNLKLESIVSYALNQSDSRPLDILILDLPEPYHQQAIRQVTQQEDSKPATYGR